MFMEWLRMGSMGILWLLAIAASKSALSKDKVFEYHPPAMLVMFLLMSISLRSFSPGPTSPRPGHNSKPPKNGMAKMKKRHYLLVLGSMLSGVLGGISIEYSKFSQNLQHFTSWHGISGSLALIFLLVQTIAGIFAYFYPQLSKQVFDTRRYWRYHRWFGYFLFLISTCSLLMSVSTRWSTYQLDLINRLFGVSNLISQFLLYFLFLIVSTSTIPSKLLFTSVSLGRYA